jgi:hypothetical protein
MLTFLIYSPWLPILSQQAQAVRQNYWIPAVTDKTIAQAFVTWVSGMAQVDVLEGLLWATPVAALILWRMIRRDRMAFFFMSQAALPWLLSLTISMWSGRSIFLDRCLVFAHFSLLGLWSVLWCRLPGTLPRLAFGFWIALPSFFGLDSVLTCVAEGEPALGKAALFLKQHYQPGDVIFVDHPQAINLLRYYSKQKGLINPTVCCCLRPFGLDSHITHEVSLQTEEILWLEENTPLPLLPKANRVWLGSDQSYRPDSTSLGGNITLQEMFEGSGGTRYYLWLYEKPP